MGTADVYERFWQTLQRGSKLDPEKCWTWPGTKTAGGYGVLRRKIKRVYAHRISYEIAYGRIPEGLVIDHICRNRLCCNPAHLEAVTNRENMLRGAGLTAQLYHMGMCAKGHVVAGSNVFMGHRKNGKRSPRCRLCVYELNRKGRMRRAGRSPDIRRDAVTLLDTPVTVIRERKVS